SGGTESNNLALIGSVNLKQIDKYMIITSKGEHPSVLDTVKYLGDLGANILLLDVDSNGIVEIGHLAAEHMNKKTIVSIAGVNNETGVIQPINEISEICRNCCFHSDMVQAIGKIELPSSLPDLMTFSAHKTSGPKSLGMLLIKKTQKITPLFHGGGQQNGLRSGTENPTMATAMAVALNFSLDELAKKHANMTELYNELWSSLQKEIPNISFNSACQGNSPYILNVSFLGAKAEVVLHMLESEGIYVSTGSACSSKKKNGSHVLKAMGKTKEEIESAIRFSFSNDNTREEIDLLMCKLPKIIKKIRKVSRR
ncbi:MAG: cysteine desulfurase family protein, partial [Anaerovoracaceae bacterium]